MSIVYSLTDALKPLFRHLAAVPIEDVPPSRIWAFIQAIEGEGTDPATVRRLARDHFGELSDDLDAIAARVIKFAEGAGGGSQAAFLNIADITKPGTQGFHIPEIDRVYQRWLTDNKAAIKAGAVDPSPDNWVRNHMSTQANLRHRVILDALLGPRALRGDALKVGPSKPGGWRVRPRVDLDVPADAEQRLINMVGDVVSHGLDAPSEFDGAVRRLYAARNMTDPPSTDDTVQAIWDYVRFFAERSNRLKDGVSDSAQVSYLQGLAGDPTALKEAVTGLYNGRGVTNPTEIQNATAALSSELAGVTGPPLTGLSPDAKSLLAMQSHHVRHTEFDGTTMAYITGGRVMHPDDFLHGLMDGFEVLGPVARSEGLVNMTDLALVTDDVPELIRFAFSGKGGRNTHGYVYELAIAVQRTIRDGTDEAGLVWKHLQVKLGALEGPDMVEMLQGLARYVQIKSYNDAGRLIGRRSEMLRQTGSDIRRTWAAMDDAQKTADGGPLKIFIAPDQGAGKEWVNVSGDKVWAIDEERLVSRFAQPTNAAGEAALAARKTAEMDRITDFATTYNNHLTNPDPPSQEAFETFLSDYDRSLGGTGLRAADKLRALRTANPNISMKELAIARLIMDDKKAGAIDADLLTRLMHPNAPPIQFEVAFSTPLAQPHRVTTDVAADAANAAH